MNLADCPFWRERRTVAEHFDYMVRMYDAAGEALPAAAVVWRYLDEQQLAALSAISAVGKQQPLGAEWTHLTPDARARALNAMRLMVELGAQCAHALELESRLRRGAAVADLCDPPELRALRTERKR